MSTPEGRVKSKIKNLLKSYRAYYTMPVMTGFATNGTPDFSVCHAGRYLAIEAKAGTPKPTKLQWTRLEEVSGAGGHTMVLNEDNLDVLMTWLADSNAGRTLAVRSPGGDVCTGHDQGVRGLAP